MERFEIKKREFDSVEYEDEYEYEDEDEIEDEESFLPDDNYDPEEGLDSENNDEEEDVPVTQQSRNVIPRGSEATIKSSVQSLGCATWNLAHFGKAQITIKLLGMKLVDLCEKWPTAYTKAAWEATQEDVAALKAWDKRILEHDQGNDNKLASRTRRSANFDYKKYSKEGHELYGRVESLIVNPGKLDEAAENHVTQVKRFCDAWRETVVKPIDESAVRDLYRVSRVSLTFWVRRLRRACRRYDFYVDVLLGVRTRIARLRTIAEQYPNRAPDLVLDAEVEKRLLGVGPKDPGSLRDMYNAVKTLDQALHKLLIVENIVEIFEHNEWLDVLLLHEVNQGIEPLKQEIEDYSKHLECRFQLCFVDGPLIKSGGGKRSQHERYPILYRKNDARFQYLTCWCIDSKGTEVDKPIEFTWNKGKKESRPIVLYDFIVDRHLVSVGVVHTTPGGSEFERRFVWSQLAEPLRILQKKKDRKFIIGGDFYLTAEAAVIKYKYRKVEHQDVEEIKKKNGQRKDSLKERIATLEKRKELSEPQKEDLKAMKFSLGKLEGMKNTDFVRNCAQLTVQAKLMELGWQVCQSVAGTNLKRFPMMDTSDVQIADFFICSEGWKSRPVGLLCNGGSVVQVDDERLSNSLYWRMCSDHFPVGGYFSTKVDDERANKILLRAEKAEARLKDLEDDIEKFKSLEVEVLKVKQNATKFAFKRVKARREFDPTWELSTYDFEPQALLELTEKQRRELEMLEGAFDVSEDGDPDDMNADL